MISLLNSLLSGYLKYVPSSLFLSNGTHTFCSVNTDFENLLCDSYGQQTYCVVNHSETYDRCTVTANHAHCIIGNNGD